MTYGGWGQEIDLDSAGDREDALRMKQQRHRLVEGSREHAPVGKARRSLMILFYEEAPLHLAAGTWLELEL